MKKNMIKRLATALIVIVLCAISVCTVLVFNSSADDNIYGGTKKKTFEKTEAVEELLATANHFVVVKHKQMGGSHYAYTEALYEHAGGTDVHYETNFFAGSQLVILSVLDNGDGTVSTYEKVVKTSTAGVFRDPSVSPDGTKVLYSYKANNYDDYHIYELSLSDIKADPVQLTFGTGRSDTEPQYLANGDIVFSSNRVTQTVDCWITPVSNLFVMSADGSNIRRVGYDQVHTTYPTVTSDGRVIYTRWDYNDRTQMFVQGVFQMFQDGTYQTEVWGNSANFPTTLLHTRDIPGASGKYISIASGHHVMQVGKLCIVDTTIDRNHEDSIKFVFPDGTQKQENVDGYGQSGQIYKYPYAISENTLLVSSSVAGYNNGRNTPFSIYLCDRSKGWAGSIELVSGTNNQPASQIVPIKNSTIFNRPSMVNYANATGTYYVADVYEGEGMEGIAKGTAKYLRVVEIVYRSSSIGATFQQTGGSNAGDPFSPIATGHGAWDVKSVLGIVPVEEDGSVMFKVPADTPVYFQLLDKDGFVIQTMRTWSTLMPGETFSCVGCHESKNTAPLVSTEVTMAMKKGVQELQPDLWMKGHDEYSDFDPYTDDSIGFDYSMVQEILDKSCVSCHNNVDIALKEINTNKAGADTAVNAIGYLIPKGAEWNYSISGGKSGSAYAPFGKKSASTTDINTIWNSGTITLTNTFNFSQWNKDVCITCLELKYAGTITVKINGTTVYTNTSDALVTETVELTDAQISALKAGKNTIEITVSGTGYYVDAAFRSYSTSGNMTIFNTKENWKYVVGTSSSAVASGWNGVSFDDSAWGTTKTPVGNRTDDTSGAWPSSNKYIWLRKTFTLTAEQLASVKGGTMSAKTFYDDTFRVYINGVEVFSENGWVDGYTLETLNGKPENIFKEGENVIAVSLYNSGGGYEFDLGLQCTTTGGATSDAPFALTGDMIFADANRMRRAYPLSYLLLTGSRPSTGGNQVAGTHWIGTPSNSYIKWNGAMSQTQVLDPYNAGSAKSNMIKKLKEGHGNLSDEDIRLIAAWIDLTVPCWGEYDEGERFTEDEARAYVERINKRNFYDQWDRYVKMSLGGVLPEGTVEVTYGDQTVSGNGFAILYPKGAYKAGQTIKVKVTGSKYVALSVNERQGEVLYYVPSGEFTYTLPTDLNTAYCTTMRGSGSCTYYRNPTIMVRIPTEDELKEERNLAFNTYNTATNIGVYPFTSSATATTGLSAPRGAVDGFVSNKSSASAWPYQAWVPAATGSNSLTVDFGREVVVNTLNIKLRAASTDTHLLSAVVTFSDGTTKELVMHDTTEFMSFDLGGKTVTKLTLGGFDKAEDAKTFGITELQVLGYDK
jgi:hypothetical protein